MPHPWEYPDSRGDWFADFRNWQPSARRACDCGSFNVVEVPSAPHGIRATAFCCDDCGAQWHEDE